MKYTKKPITVEAWVWDETRETLDALVSAGMEWTAYDGWAAGHKDRNTVTNLRIATLEGPMDARNGDRIVKGIAGEFYPVKPDIFEATYSPAVTGEGLVERARDKRRHSYLGVDWEELQEYADRILELEARVRELEGEAKEDNAALAKCLATMKLMEGVIKWSFELAHTMPYEKYREELRRTFPGIDFIEMPPISEEQT